MEKRNNIRTRNSVIFQIDVADSYIICVAMSLDIYSIDTLCFYWSKRMSRLDTFYFY